MPWVKRTLRGTQVLARARDDGTLDAGPDGRVDVKYSPGEGAKLYRAAARNLGPADPEDGAPAPPAVAVASAQAVIVYTDGACTGNPGPMGIGVVILDGKHRREIGEFIGEGTNNIAELTAIERALDAVDARDRARPVLIHADSSYAIGVVSGAYKAKKNVELIERIRRKASQFGHLRFVKVAGHAGVAENERCDALATQSISRRGGRR